METTPFRAYQAGTQPPYDAPAYGSTHKRHPQQGLVPLPHTLTETSGARFSVAQFPPIPDLSVVDGKAALGERIIVHGRIPDEDGRSVPHTIVEIWQANASGRYHHPADQHDAPTDPNFHGEGRVYTNGEGAGIGSPRSSPAPIPGAITTMPGGRPISTSRFSARALPSGSSLRCISPVTRCSSSTRSFSRSPTRRRATTSSASSI